MPLELNSDNYESEVIQSEIPVLVDFWGPQCGPCLALLPHVEKLEETYASDGLVLKIRCRETDYKKLVDGLRDASRGQVKVFKR